MPDCYSWLLVNKGARSFALAKRRRLEEIAIDLADEIAGRLCADRVPMFMRRFYG